VTLVGSLKVTPEDIGNINLVSNPSISPEGNKVLYVVAKANVEKDRYDSQILLLNVNSEEIVAIEENLNDFCPLFSPNGKRFAFLRKVEKEGVELRVGNVEALGTSRLVSRFKSVSAMSWDPSGRRLVVVAQEEVEKQEDVKKIERIPPWFNGMGYVYNVNLKPFIVDIDSGIMEKIDIKEAFWARDVEWSPDGKRIAITVSKSELEPYIVDLYVYDIDKREAEKVKEGFSGASLVTWSPDSSKVALIGHRRERGFSTHNKVYIIDLETGEEKCITCSLDRNAMNTVNSDVRFQSCSKPLAWREDGIYFLVSDRGSVDLYVVNEKGDIVRKLSLDESVIDEFSVSRSGKVALTYMSPTRPKELMVIEGDKPIWSSRHNEAWTKSRRIARPQRFTYRSNDGTEIEGWILRAEEEKGWALYIHGGPKTMWGYSFMHEFQVLVSSGISVIYVNPRGSDGYSQDFADIRCHYGEKDYEDLIAGTKYAIEKFGLPKERGAVMGGSYGGFMTNWVVGHTDMFRSAVTMRSISNWISMFGTTDIGWYFVKDQICCTPWESPELCWEKSPLKYANRIRTPLLIIHSNEDYRCWLDQALQLFTALRLHGVKTRLVIFPGENHDLSRSGRPKHRVERLKTIVEWLRETLEL
jgi:dipeptidyl aminopeptidase/acylaminoacyl peptidase